MPPSHNRSPASQGADPFDMSSARSALPAASDVGGTELSAIRIRKLPYNFDHAQLRSLLTFADRLEGADFVKSSPPDQGCKTAIARFYSASAAQQAQSVLDGKQIDPEKQSLSIDFMRFSPGGSMGFDRQNFDLSSTRAHSNSSVSSAQRYNGQYQPRNRITPPGAPPYTNGLPSNDSPFSPSHPDSRQRVLGRDVIGEDDPDDETSDLLRDPMGYATNGMNGLSRRNTGNSSSARYHNLPLSTSNPTSPQSPVTRHPATTDFNLRSRPCQTASRPSLLPLRTNSDIHRFAVLRCPQSILRTRTLRATHSTSATCRLTLQRTSSKPCSASNGDIDVCASGPNKMVPCASLNLKTSHLRPKLSTISMGILSTIPPNAAVSVSRSPRTHSGYGLVNLAAWALQLQCRHPDSSRARTATAG